MRLPFGVVCSTTVPTRTVLVDPGISLGDGATAEGLTPLIEIALAIGALMEDWNSHTPGACGAAFT
jgi:hypothetical protein